MTGSPEQVSPGEEVGGTIIDALEAFAQRGYIGTFGVEKSAGVRCFGCQQVDRAHDYAFHDTYRIEGTSDPDDMALIGALQCPTCGARGCIVLAFGPHASAEELAVLSELDTDQRHKVEPHKLA